MENITKATAVHSGGNIYLYYAELENKQWIMGNDEWLIIINTDPLVNEDTFYNSGYYEWQVEHLVKEISEEEYQKILNKILETIFDGKTIKKYDNFAMDELLYRYKK